MKISDELIQNILQDIPGSKKASEGDQGVRVLDPRNFSGCADCSD